MTTDRMPKQPRLQVPREIEQITAALEEDIIFGRMGPGARLAEDELISRFGAKRYAVREALRKLEALGVVSRLPNKGATVRSFSRKELEDIHATREILAREAAELIPFPVDPKAIERLQAIQDSYARSADNDELLEINRLNNAFHSMLFSLCENRQLRDLVDHFAWLTQAFRAISILDVELRNHARKEHQAMIEALKRGDRDRLVALCVDHMRPARDIYFRARGWL